MKPKKHEKTLVLTPKMDFRRSNVDFSKGLSRSCPIVLQGGVFDKKAFQTLHSPLKAPR